MEMDAPVESSSGPTYECNNAIRNYFFFLTYITHVGNGTSRDFLRHTKQKGEDELRRTYSPKNAAADL